MKIDLCCASYSVLSKRLRKLNLNRPFYRNTSVDLKNIKSIAIDSSGLKCFGYEEWHIHKYDIQEKKAYKKLHLVVDQNHLIQNSELTDSHTQDQSVVNKLITPLEKNVRHVTADGAYDSNPTYKIVSVNILNQRYPRAGESLFREWQKSALEKHKFKRK